MAETVRSKLMFRDAYRKRRCIVPVEGLACVAIIHELCRKFDVRLIACLSFLAFAVIFAWIGLFDKHGYFDQTALPMVFFGLSLAAFFTPLAALAIHGLPGARAFRSDSSHSPPH